MCHRVEEVIYDTTLLTLDGFASSYLIVMTWYSAVGCQTPRRMVVVGQVLLECLSEVR
jgi:hypothetical protein